MAADTGLATLEQTKTRIGQVGTSLDTTITELLLAVSSEIERVAGRRLRASDDLIERYTGGTKSIRLVQSPIRAIEHVREGTTTTQDWTDSDLYEVLSLYEDYIYEPSEVTGKSGILRRQGRCWAGNDETSPGMIEVKYNGGFALAGITAGAFPIPDDLRGACITQVSHELETRKAPGQTESSMRGVAIASGALNAHAFAMDLLPSVARVALSYARLF